MERYCRKPDCLNTIRLLAALQVVFVHSNAHLGLQMPEWLSWLLGFFSGVPVFFTLSGFLIWMSIGRSRDFGDYCRKRFWRIFPELWAAVALELVVLCILNWRAINWIDFTAFAACQSTVFQFWTPESLRTYGCGVPNGSLWTICVIIQFYVVAWLLYKLLHGKSVFRWVALMMALVAVAVASNIATHEIIFKLYSNTVIPYLWMFILGAMASEYREKVLPFAVKFWWILILAFAGFRLLGIDLRGLKYGVLFTVLQFLSCMAIGFRFPVLNARTDISYGIYIYHMTIVNALLVLYGTGGGWLRLVCVVALTCAVSWLSALTVGSYGLRRKSVMAIELK